MYYFEPLAPDSVSARALVLSLMSSAQAGPQTIARLIHAAALFGIEASTLRVAVARLIKDGLLESPERGLYRPGPKAQAFTRRVQDWQNVRARMAHWDGNWLVALTHQLGRTDRKQLRARERALALSGYREADAGLWVRPANLVRALEDHRMNLVAIGADEAIMLLRVSETAMPEVPGWSSLWPPQQLARAYATALSAMQESLAGLPSKRVDDAARETLLTGQAVIRLINFDPLLPPELGPQADFLRVVDAMRHYNEVGQKYWRAYNAGAPASTPGPKA